MLGCWPCEGRFESRPENFMIFLPLLEDGIFSSHRHRNVFFLSVWYCISWNMHVCVYKYIYIYIYNIYIYYMPISASKILTKFWCLNLEISHSCPCRYWLVERSVKSLSPWPRWVVRCNSTGTHSTANELFCLKWIYDLWGLYLYVCICSCA